MNAYAASTLFAVDRYASYKEDWGKDYEAGELILANRYTTSNAVHQHPSWHLRSAPPLYHGCLIWNMAVWAFLCRIWFIYLDVPTDLSEGMLRRGKRPPVLPLTFTNGMTCICANAGSVLMR